MKRDAFTLPLDLGRELIIDNFAGGGGTSEGLEQAFGRPVDIAINHDPQALAMHAMNHPHTRHLCESVWTVNPVAVTRNQPVGLVWLSPDCKHFSKAKGGTPVEKHIRGLAWVGMRWVALTKPRVLMLENVEEFQEWGPLIIDAEGNARPDPAKKGRTFESFVRQLRAHGYTVDWRELRACDYGAPTIRKRLFLVARRDGLPITWPEPTHAEPSSRAVLAGKLQPWRTAAECIDFTLPSRSIFDRAKPLAENTQRRVAKGLWRHVLTSPRPFIVGVGGRMGQSPARGVDQPAQTITAKADSCLAMPVVTPFVADQSRPAKGATASATEPLRTQCAQVKGGHFTLVEPVLAAAITTFKAGHPGAAADAPVPTLTTHGHQALTTAALAPLRGTTPAHMGGHSPEQPLSTVAASGTHHALVSANLVTIGYGEAPGQAARTHDVRQPLGTVVAARKHALAAVHLTHLTHHGERAGRAANEPLATITSAHRGEQALVSAFLEQANGGFYQGEGRAADVPLSTITASGSNQQLVTAYCVKYYSKGGQWQGLAEPMHTLPTKARMGLVETVQVPLDGLAPELRDRARQCAQLLHRYLPEHFPMAADLVLIGPWVLVDILLRMLVPRELFSAQGFPKHYVIEEIPDPAQLFRDGHQAEHPLALPRIPLTNTAQVRMCGNSVSPVLSHALAVANFSHERLIYGEAA